MSALNPEPAKAARCTNNRNADFPTLETSAEMAANRFCPGTIALYAAPSADDT
ncbi:hypothetical protein [Labrenzia sp. DG1229]|uniref:hypothetical protein n=1 Tax=Labrenzia sp. DG1229 TaxID=681847 RepID=UPI000B13883C|nr:hypothetical protein [Labrenzia sp. DG1229]